MGKTILIPTDLKIESLNTLKYAAIGEDEEVILMYSLSLSDSITELLFYSSEKIIASLVSSEFEEAITILKNRFGKKISEISIKLFHGYTINAFRGFTDANGIEKIYVPKNYKLQLPSSAFDPLPLIRRSKLPVTEVEWETGNYNFQSDRLDTLFN